MPLLNLFEPKFNTSFIKRSRFRENQDIGILGDAAVSVNWIRNIVITLFFTPVVAVTSLFAKNSIISLANLFLVLFSLCEFIYRAFRSHNRLDTFLTIIGIITAVILAITFATNFLPVVVTFTSIFDSLNIVATAINSYFAIKDVINPFIIKIIRHILKLFGKSDLVKIYRAIEINAADPHDRHCVNTIIRKYKDIRYGNSVLKVLEYYINKYSEVFLGNIIKKSEINKLRDGALDLAQKGVIPSATIYFFTCKINSKITKLQILLEIIEELNTAQQRVKEFGPQYIALLKKYFYNIPSPDLKDIDHNIIAKELHKHLRIQFKKFLILRSSLPVKIANDISGVISIDQQFIEMLKSESDDDKFNALIDEYIKSPEYIALQAEPTRQEAIITSPQPLTRQYTQSVDRHPDAGGAAAGERPILHREASLPAYRHHSSFETPRRR